MFTSGQQKSVPPIGLKTTVIKRRLNTLDMDLKMIFTTYGHNPRLILKDVTISPLSFIIQFNDRKGAIEFYSSLIEEERQYWIEI